MSENVLEVENLSKFYRSRVAVDSVSFSIKAGEIFGLIGPNGAGKTTILKMACGLSAISEGNVTVNGFDIQSEFESAIEKVGGIIEEPKMYGYLSGLENLKYYASLYGEVDKARIDYLVEFAKMQNRIKDKVRTYSLGMRQRLGIVQALINKPSLLILDEPVNGLDPSGIIELRELLKKVAKEENVAILISSHNLAELENLCDTVAIIKNGKMIANKPIADLEQGLRQTQRFAVKVSHPNYAGKIVMDKFQIEDVKVISNSVILRTNEEKLQEILRELISSNISIFGTMSITKSLEEVYYEMVTNKGESANFDIM